MTALNINYRSKLTRHLKHPQTINMGIDDNDEHKKKRNSRDQTIIQGSTDFFLID